MSGFDQRFIDELKLKNDIVDVIGRYCRLEQKGSTFWGRCPFHHEKTASFSVNSANQFYYCFGCHKSGDVITFIREIESLDFNDAVKFLAERAHMPLPEINYDDQKVKEQKRQKEAVLNILRDTAMFYVKNLRTPQAQKHVEYLKKRKLTDETVLKFGIGASLDFDTLPRFLIEKGYSYQDMLLAGVVDEKRGRYFDSLGGRLIIPMINQFNQVIAFVGRLLEKSDFAKYKNTKETIVFSKGNTLFNINNLKKLKNEKGLDSIIIVEGHIDVISLVQAGFRNVVASMGTAFTKNQARLLRRFADKIFISYDGDFAGQKASIRGLEILQEEGLDVKVVSMPDGKDPDDVVKEGGTEAYQKLIDGAMPLIDFKIDILKKTFDLKTADGRRKFVKEAIRVIKTSASPAEQEDLLKTVRDLTGTTFEALKRELYSTEEVKESSEVKIPEFNETLGDKTMVASRFILCAFLFNKPYSVETELENIEFILPLHKSIQDYIINCKKEGRRVNFSDLYELYPEEDMELSQIASMETDENKKFDQAIYFNDCVRTLKFDVIDKKLDKLKTAFKQETDIIERQKIAKEMSMLVAQKNRKF